MAELFILISSFDNMHVFLHSINHTDKYKQILDFHIMDCMIKAKIITHPDEHCIIFTINDNDNKMLVTSISNDNGTTYFYDNNSYFHLLAYAIENRKCDAMLFFSFEYDVLTHNFYKFPPWFDDDYLNSLATSLPEYIIDNVEYVAVNF